MEDFPSNDPEEEQFINFTLGQRVRLMYTMTQQYLYFKSSFTTKVYLKEVTTDENVPVYEPPFRHSEIYVDALLPEDLVSDGTNPPNLKKPVSKEIEKLLHSLNPTRQCMVVFQSQDWQKNFYDKVFGGCVASVVDQVASNTILSAELNTEVSTSVDISTQFLRALPCGERMFIVCDVKNDAVPNGRQAAYLKSKGIDTKGELQFGGFNSDFHLCLCNIYDEKGRLCVKASHLKVTPSERINTNSLLKGYVGKWGYLDDKTDIERRGDKEVNLKGRIQGLREAYLAVLKKPKL